MGELLEEYVVLETIGSAETSHVVNANFSALFTNPPVPNSPTVNAAVAPYISYSTV